MARGFDCGTMNLVCARRGEGDEIKCRREVNAFIKIPLTEKHAFNMFKKSGVNLIERNNNAYIIGEGAVSMAYALNVPLSRPMKDGTLNPGESNAYEILKTMIHSLIGEVEKDKEVIYYSVPANAVNLNTDADFHQKVLDQIFKSYKVNNKTVVAYPINEALALVYAELASKFYTGLAASFGAGQVNFCYSIFSQPAIKFSLVNSGDWIDHQVAKATNETPVVVNKEKTKIDLLKMPTSPMERAISTTYRILIENTFQQIKKSILEAGNKVKAEQPLNLILGGGTASPNGFEHIVREVINSIEFPVPIDEIIKPKDHFYSVARGCLVAAEESK